MEALDCRDRLEHWAEQEGRWLAKPETDPRPAAEKAWDTASAMVHHLYREIAPEEAHDLWLHAFVRGWRQELADQVAWQLRRRGP